MCAHELILGKAVDYITGETIVDTIDERARQKIARFLVEDRGYEKNEIEVRRRLSLHVDGEQGLVTVDFLVKLGGRTFLILIFGPGSLVSRERPALAAARLVEPYAVPFVAVTNGESAEILETASGRVLAEGLTAIPTREEARQGLGSMVFEPLGEEALARERRILFAFDVLARRECDEFTCSLYP